MPRASLFIFLLLWVISIAVFFYVLLFSPSEWFSWLGSGICIGVAVAETGDIVREHFYYKKYRNYRER